MLRLRWLIFLLAGWPALATATETAYVIDKLLVGVHRERDLNSGIIKVLPTGTALEVLERREQLARVKDPEGVEGWVDAAYLMKEPSAASQLADARQERQMLLERIKALEARTATGAAPAGTVAVPADRAKLDALTNENTELKSQLSSLKLRGSELEEQLKARVGRDVGADGSIAGELRKANLQLSDALDDLKRRNAELEAQVAADSALGRAASAIRLTSPWALLGMLVMLGLAFAAGMYCMDYLNRRRHGGFRL